MKVILTKVSDSVKGNQFETYKIIKKTESCCEKFRDLNADYPLWNLKVGKLCFVATSLDGDFAYFPIGFCPFCGEKITYVEMESGSEISP